MQTGHAVRYRAFISYSHADEVFAARLHSRLERYRLPARLVSARGLVSNRLGIVFRDRDELASSTSLSATIREALAESECLIVVCSPDAARSQWVSAEIETFRSLHEQRHPPASILPIIAAHVADGGASDKEDNRAQAGALFPEALAAGDEPLAADARSSGDGDKRALLKLIAGILDVRFDELVERETVRRRQRALTGAAMLTVVLGGGALLLDQTRRAEDEAREQRAQAAALIDYMVTDLTERLAEYEELGELDQGLSQALNYFASFEADELDDDTLNKYRTALIGVGSVRLRQGKLEEALENFERSMELSEVAAGRSENDADQWYELAQNTYYVGEAHWEMQDIPTAATYIERSLAQARRAAELAPENLAFRLEVVFGLNNMGAVLTREKRYREAIASLEASLAENERMRSQFPQAEEDLLNQEVESVSWLAEIVPTLGDYDQAFVWHEQEIRLRESLHERTGNIHHLARLSDALGYYARTLAEVGRTGAAAEVLGRKVTISEALYRADPDNVFWRTRRSLGQALLAVELFHGGDSTAALSELDLAETGLADLLLEDRNTEVVKLHLAYVATNRAYFSLDEPLVALVSLDEAFAVLEGGLVDSSASPVLFDYYLRAVVLESVLLRRLGRAAVSERLERALGLMAERGEPEQSVRDAAMLSLLMMAQGGSATERLDAVDEKGFRSEYFLRMRAASRTWPPAVGIELD